MLEIGRRGLLASAAAAGLAGPVSADAPPSRAGMHPVPETLPMRDGFGLKTPVRGNRGLAITGHPLATQVAVDVLRAGGNACDALLSAAISQTVVEPHLTTLTGCLSLMYFDAGTGKTSYLNGNVNAPQTLPESFSEADVATGKMVTVPGYWAAVEAAAKAFGTLPPSTLVKPAIAFAREGIAAHPSLWGEIYSRQVMLARTEQGRSMFMPRRAILNPGELLRQPIVAETLQRLGEEGGNWFYRGEFARDFTALARSAGGTITPDDMAAYEVRWDEPVRGRYRDLDIVGSAPPDTGGMHLIELLNMVELMDIRANGPASESPQTLSRMMLAARDVLVGGLKFGDPRHTDLDIPRIISKEYAADRYRRILAGETAVGKAVARPGSCHLTVVDGQGNVATALHSTLSLPWVNGLFVHGLSICGAGNHFLNSMPKPGGRITVLICPNILFKDGKPFIASGSPSLSLVSNIVQNVTNIVDFGMTIEESVGRPSFGGMVDGKGSMSVELDLGERLIRAVEKAGIPVERLNPWSSRHGAFEGIHFASDGQAHACGDPRRTSAALAA